MDCYSDFKGFGHISTSPSARTERDNIRTYYFFLINILVCSYLKIQKRIGQATDITSVKRMAMDGLLGCLLLMSGFSLTLANSDPHSGFPTWLSNNLE